MSHFYGTLQGSRGETIRCGTKSSGLEVIAASWSGSVRTSLFQKDGEPWARVSLCPWCDHGISLLLYEGPIGGPQANSSDVEKALRCKTCLNFKNWESINKEKHDGS